MGLPGMVLSAIAAVAGAIMYWAITAQSSVQNGGIRLSTVGVILMIAGGIGFVVSLAIFMMSSRRPTNSNHSIDRITKDEAGHTTELHEEQH